MNLNLIIFQGIFLIRSVDAQCDSTNYNIGFLASTSFDAQQSISTAIFTAA